MVSTSREGVTQNSAPASMQWRAVVASSTVPAPRTRLSPNWSQACSRILSAPGTVMVTSSTGIPAPWITLIASSAWLAVSVRTIGMMPEWRMVFKTSCLAIAREPSADTVTERQAGTASAGAGVKNPPGRPCAVRVRQEPDRTPSPGPTRSVPSAGKRRAIPIASRSPGVPGALAEPR